MASLYEYNNTGDDGGLNFLGVNWTGQTFTVGSSAHTVTSVKMKFWRAGSPGTLTLSIRNTSGGKPTGGDLTSGSMDANTITPTSPGLWYEITVTVITLSASVQYAIVIRVPNGSAGNYVNMRYRITGTYSGGYVQWSQDSGVTWQSSFSGQDAMFEVWGNPPVSIPTVTTQAATGIGLD